MAEIVKNGKKRVSPDMTPMVDLGFLLITFFMFTTTFSNPNAMSLFMPDDTGDTSPVIDDNTLTFILGENDRVFWYQKALSEVKSEDLVETDYSLNGIRAEILKRRNIAPKPENFTVIIKSTDKSNYKNTVDILDEMEITKNKHYAIVDLKPIELNAYTAKMNSF